jgi:hypothetical protein
MRSKTGEKIYEQKKKRFYEKGRNTDNWNKNKKGKYFRNIVSHFGGRKIPYSCFGSSKELSMKLFKSNNDWNYIYYPIFMGLHLGYLSEESDGLKYSG